MTGTATQTDTPTLPPNTGVELQCLEAVAKLPTDYVSNGSIILLPQGGSDRPNIVNFPTGVNTYLPDDWDWSDWDISPDGKLLARNRFRGNTKDFQDILGVDIMIISGDLLATVPWETGWSGYNWVDNERLKFFTPESEPCFDSITVLNPFTGERQDIPFEFPDVHPYLGPRCEFDPTVYDSTLTRVVYPRLTLDASEWVLWDLQNHRPLATVPSIEFRGHEPKWSPDGSQVVIPANTPTRGFEFYSISRDGHVTRLTYLTTSAPFADIRHYNWSPNGQSIAFWYRTDVFEGEHLAVLNVDTQEVTSYCVPGDMRPSGRAEAPIWSPNGKQLVVQSYDVDSNIHVFVVDIGSGFYAEIAKGMLPVAWMENVPLVWMK